MCNILKTVDDAKNLMEWEEWKTELHISSAFTLVKTSAVIRCTLLKPLTSEFCPTAETVTFIFTLSFFPSSTPSSKENQTLKLSILIEIK